VHSGTIFIEELDLLTGGFDVLSLFAAGGANALQRLPEIMSRAPLNSPSTGTRAGHLGEVNALDPSATELPASSPLRHSRTEPLASTIVERAPAFSPLEIADRAPPERLDLARGAPQIRRRHLARAVVRVAVLLTGDACALLVLRFIMQGIRDQAWFGATAASLAAKMIPMGAVPLVQLLPAVFLGLLVLDNYGASDRRRDAGRLVAGSAFGLALPFWGYIWNRFSPLAIPGFFLLAAATAIALIWERQLIDRVVRKLRPIGPGAVRVLLIGRPDETPRAQEHPALSDRREFAVSGVFNPDEIIQAGAAGAATSLCRKIRQCKADTLVLCGRLDDATFSVIMDATAAAGCHLLALTRAFSVVGVEPQLIWRRGAPLVALNRPGLRGRQLLLKRMLDLVGSLAGLIILAPVMALIALAIRIDSRGPAVFSQQRVGLGGRPFRCFKFRSMKADAEQLLHSDEDLLDEYRRNHFKLPEEKDPRLTRMGRLLRKASLDELPQLWNVLVGEMSLVGPRPIVPEELNHYGDGAFLFLSLKPGMTGAWAVQGRSQVGYPDRVDIELAYIREWSLGADLGILLQTIPAVLERRGAF
jgi:exopolysaccharide biosynthesis polyprenyl glycosylphosphotransferase